MKLFMNSLFFIVWLKSTMPRYRWVCLMTPTASAWYRLTLSCNFLRRILASSSFA